MTESTETIGGGADAGSLDQGEEPQASPRGFQKAERRSVEAPRPWSRPSVAANAPAGEIYELPHIGLERMLLHWREQPDKFVPLIARQYGRTRHLGFRSSNSFLGRVLWRSSRNAIGEFEDLAYIDPWFGGSAHHLPPKHAEPGQCSGVNRLDSMRATTDDSENMRGCNTVDLLRKSAGPKPAPTGSAAGSTAKAPSICRLRRISP